MMINLYYINLDLLFKNYPHQAINLPPKKDTTKVDVATILKIFD